MPDLRFSVDAIKVASSAAIPTLLFKLGIENSTPEERIHSILLRCQVQIQVARRSYTAEEKEKIGAQLANVLTYIEKLKEVDVTGVEPTAHAFPLVNVTRPDEVRPSMSNEEALSNAPAHANGLFIVPKIVE